MTNVDKPTEEEIVNLLKAILFDFDTFINPMMDERGFHKFENTTGAIRYYLERFEHTNNGGHATR